MTLGVLHVMTWPSCPRYFADTQTDVGVGFLVLDAARGRDDGFVMTVR
jgi:hypothetical protein